jgi:hypothetical protein
MSYHVIWSNHVIRVKSCHSCQIMSFMSNHVIHVKTCHSCQNMSFMSNLVIHVKSCHSCQIMSFMSNLVNYVKSCQIMSFMSNSAIHDFSRNSVKSGGQGRGGGQIGLPKPSATASLSGRRQKCRPFTSYKSMLTDCMGSTGFG